jgi:hypothetical protein
LTFSGEYEYGGKKLSESSVNGFPSNEIEKNLKKIHTEYWRDIDLGGFRIYHHLQSTVLPNLAPLLSLSGRF